MKEESDLNIVIEELDAYIEESEKASYGDGFYLGVLIGLTRFKKRLYERFNRDP